MRQILGFYEVPEVKVQEMAKMIKIKAKAVKGSKPAMHMVTNKELGVIGIYIEGKHFMIDHMEARIQELQASKVKKIAIEVPGVSVKTGQEVKV